MPGPDDDKKMKEAAAAQQAEREREDAKKKLAIAAEAEQNKKGKKVSDEDENVEKNETTVTQKTAFAEEILEAYRKAFPNRELKEKNSLTFSTLDEAVEFMDGQAKENREFFCNAVKNGEPTDFYIFSCGTGKAYSGTLAQIKDKMEEHQKENPDLAAKISAGLQTIEAQMRIKNTVNMKEQLKQNNPETNKSEAQTATTQTPFPTTPTPGA